VLGSFAESEGYSKIVGEGGKIDKTALISKAIDQGAKTIESVLGTEKVADAPPRKEVKKVESRKREPTPPPREPGPEPEAGAEAKPKKEPSLEELGTVRRSGEADAKPGVGAKPSGKLPAKSKTKGHTK